MPHIIVVRERERANKRDRDVRSPPITPSEVLAQQLKFKDEKNEMEQHLEHVQGELHRAHSNALELAHQAEMKKLRVRHQMTLRAACCCVYYDQHLRAVCTCACCV